MLDLFSLLTRINLDAARSVNADANRTGVDVSPYIGTGIALLSGLNSSGTAPTLDVKLQESDDNSTFTDVAGGAFAQLTTGAGSEVISINFDSAKKYLRVVDDVGGTSPVFIRSVTLFGRKQVTG